MLISLKDIVFYGLLVKGFNTPPSQGGIHGFETRTGYQMIIKLELRMSSSFKIEFFIGCIIVSGESMKSNENINFIFKSLDKKKITICFLIDAFLDFIYYLVPFTFTLFLTLPFTVEKALIVIGIFMISKSLRVIGNYHLRKYSDKLDNISNFL